MASANLRYIAIRKRLASLLAESGAPSALYPRLVRELYRALPHYSAIGVFGVEDAELTLLASHGVEPAQAQEMASGLAATAVSSRTPILLVDIGYDQRVRRAYAEIVAETVVPVLRDQRTVLVLDVQSERPGALSRSDLELLGWLATELAKVSAP